MITIKKYTKKYGRQIILSDVDLLLPNKGIVTILGESGSGKSTLLNSLAGIDLNYDGKIDINGFDFKAHKLEEIVDYRLRNIGYVFQNFNLLNLETIESNIALPLVSSTNSKRIIINQRIDDVLMLTKMLKKKDQNVNKLSGGEKQRTAICRAMINNPILILCDEPTGALDEQNSPQIFSILRQISNNSLVLIATHDEENAYKYSDKIYKILNRKLILIKDDSCVNKNNVITASTGKKIKKTKIPFLYKLKYAFHKLRSKKYRSVFTNMMLSLSFTGIGLSFLLSNSLTTSLQNSLSNIVDVSKVVMSTKVKNQNVINAVYSAPESMVTNIAKKYPDYVSDIGVNYVVNFEDFFKDCNHFYVGSSFYEIALPSYSARSINEFMWLNNKDDAVCYPFTPHDLSNDEIILGITYVDMVNLCFSLQIQRSFSSLGNYIKEKGLSIVLEVQNDDWQYYDEQIFTVAAIMETSIPKIFHYSSTWNKWVFEEQMRFPYDDDQEIYFPWEMYRLLYFYIKKDVVSFLNLTLLDSSLYDFVFERDSKVYSPMTFIKNGRVESNKVFVFIADKSTINCSLAKIIQSGTDGIEGFTFTSEFGYSSYANGIVSGFSKNVFASFDESKNNDAIDADTCQNADGLDLKLPPGIVQGNYINSINGGLVFSSIKENFLSGRAPKNNNEIAISSGLGKSLNEENFGVGKYLYLSAVKNESIDNQGKIIKTYETVKLVVTGIIESNTNTLYHNDMWTISFFRDQIGVSNFNLIPTNIVFNLRENANPNEIVEKLNKSFREYEFSNPSIELTKSINESFTFISIMINTFTILALLISIILLYTVIILNILESKSELSILNYIGVSKKEIKSLFLFEVIIECFISLLISIVELVLITFVLSRSLSAEFNFSITLFINPLPFLFFILIGFFVPIIFSKIMLFFMFKDKRVKKLL